MEAFVSTLGAARWCGAEGLPVSSGRQASERVSVSRRTLSMGYGDYSYSTDKTQGHTNNYYIDKFRISSDFGTMGSSKAKSTDGIPAEGIPQLEGALARQPGAPEDPRVLEASGAVYPWDPNYVDPSKSLDSIANVEDPEVADLAFQQFRAASAQERGQALSTFSIAAGKRDEIFSSGFSERKALTLSGQLENEGARLAKKRSYPMFTPYGTPQTEIPGTPYLNSVGALDYIDTTTKAGEEEWKSTNPPEPTYKVGAAASPSPLPPSSSSLPQLGGL